jgi:hypothetical protein
MLKFIILFLITLACSACSGFKYKADNETEFASLVQEWLDWKFKGLLDQIENGEYQLNLLLSYDDKGYLIECAIEDNDKLKKFENEICNALEDIGYPKARNQTISNPVKLNIKN